jgi:hypothetical protein
MPESTISADSWASKLLECCELLRQNFLSDDLLMLNLPTYAAWFRSQSVLASYTRYVDVLRLIGAHEPQKRWLLKAPHHTPAIDALLRVFPDACIVQTHRDPVQSIPSFCSLIHSAYSWQWGREGEEATSLGPWQCTYWRSALDRVQAAVSWRDPQQFFHVDNRAFLADPLGTVRSLYDRFTLMLSPDVEKRMRAWVAQHPPRQAQYATKFWGVSAAEIATIFSDYRAQHGFA